MFKISGTILLPISLLLLVIGISSVKTNAKKGLWLKLTLAINTSLVMLLTFLGCCGKNGNLTIPLGCYKPPEESDLTKIPVKFEESSDWATLENWLISLEDKISREDYDDDFLDRFGETVWPAIEGLRNDGLITDDDSEIIAAYCESRRAYYSHVIGGATCYTPTPIPKGKEAAKEDVVTAANALRRLYAEGKIDTPAYDTAFANLDGSLKLYTGMEDNVVLRQLLLDLADGRSGAYFE